MTDLAQIQAQALHDSRRQVERLRAGLQAIVSDMDVVPWPFAEALLKGATVEEAKAAAGPLSPPSDAVEQSFQRLLARRELVKAALKLADTDAAFGQWFLEFADKGKQVPPNFELEAAWNKAVAGLVQACAAFRAAGGNETTG